MHVQVLIRRPAHCGFVTMAIENAPPIMVLLPWQSRVGRANEFVWSCSAPRWLRTRTRCRKFRRYFHNDPQFQLNCTFEGKRPLYNLYSLERGTGNVSMCPVAGMRVM